MDHELDQGNVMDAVAGLELIRLDDGKCSVVVRMVGAGPLAPEFLDVELVVESRFANVHTDMVISRDDLDDLAGCLDLLEEGERDVSGEPVDVTWSWSGRQPWLGIIADDPIRVEVGDPTRTGIQVRVPLDLRCTNERWIEDSRERLRAVREAWDM